MGVMTTLTATYCAFCDAVVNLYKNVKRIMTPKFDRKTYRELSQMTDRELNDINIARSEIKAICMGTYKPHGR